MIDHLDSTVSANLVAIDIAKDWNVVLVQETSGARRSFKVANRKQDHDRLVVFLKSLPGRVVAAVEPTGDYHRPLAYRLLSEGIDVVSISSVALARVREARYGRGIRTIRRMRRSSFQCWRSVWFRPIMTR